MVSLFFGCFASGIALEKLPWVRFREGNKGPAGVILPVE